MIRYNQFRSAGVAHLVERDLAKVEVASSSLVARSKKYWTPFGCPVFFYAARRLEQAGPGVSRDGNHPVDGCQGRVRVGGGSRRAICSRCASRAAVLRPAARGAAFFSPRCFRHWRRFGEKLVARRFDDCPFGWCFVLEHSAPFVGAEFCPAPSAATDRRAPATRREARTDGADRVVRPYGRFVVTVCHSTGVGGGWGRAGGTHRSRPTAGDDTVCYATVPGGGRQPAHGAPRSSRPAEENGSVCHSPCLVAPSPPHPSRPVGLCHLLPKEKAGRDMPPFTLRLPPGGHRAGFGGTRRSRPTRE